MNQQTELAIDLAQTVYNNTINSLTQQRDALAEQNRMLKEALLFCMRATVLVADNAPESPIGKLYKAASDAYELPDLSASILNQRDIKILSEAIGVCEELLLGRSTFSSDEIFGIQCSIKEIERLAAEKEKQ